MAIDNLLSLVFSDEDKQNLRKAAQLINEVVQGKSVNLTPEERRQYGSIADRNKILVDKAKFYMETAPQTVPQTIDKAEFDRDYVAREALDTPLKELKVAVEKLEDLKILLDFDNFQSSLSYYRFIKYLSKQNEPGTTAIYQDMSQHYHGGRKKKDDKPTPATPDGTATPPGTATPAGNK